MPCQAVDNRVVIYPPIADCHRFGTVCRVAWDGHQPHLRRGNASKRRVVAVRSTLACAHADVAAVTAVQVRELVIRLIEARQWIKS
jgi:hypothetical protein